MLFQRTTLSLPQSDGVRLAYLIKKPASKDTGFSRTAHAVMPEKGKQREVNHRAAQPACWS